MLGNDLWRAFGNELSTMLARARTEVYDPVSRTHGIFIMFDDQNGVAQVAHAFQSFDQTAVVALVQANARLIQDIENAH